MTDDTPQALLLPATEDAAADEEHAAPDARTPRVTLQAVLAAESMDGASALLDKALGIDPGDVWLLHRAAVVARQRRDWKGAEGYAARLRAVAPDEASGYSTGIEALRQQQRPEDMRALAGLAVARFPRAEWALRAAAAAAQQAGDWAEAATLCQQLRMIAPGAMAGYQIGALALRHLGRGEDEEAVLAEAVERFPRERWALADHAAAARGRGDWPAAVARAERLRAAFPETAAGYVVGSHALRMSGRHDEADQVLGVAMQRFPDEDWPLTEAAWVARQRGDWPEAARRADSVRAAFPDNTAGYMVGIVALREQGRLDAATALVQQAEGRFGPQGWVSLEAASVAARRGDLAEANRRWNAILALEPGNEHVHRIAAQSNVVAGRYGDAEHLLRQAAETFAARTWPRLELAKVARMQGQFQHADQILSAAAARFPDNSDVLLQHALMPVAAFVPRNRDLPETVRRLRALHERFPRFAPGWSAHIRALRENGRLKEAEAVAAAAAERVPDHAGIIVEHARATLARGDAAGALAMLRAAAERLSEAPEIATELGRLLCRSAPREEAEAFLSEAMTRFPATVDLASAYAQAAVLAQDWPEALRRWRLAQERFPQDPTVRVGVSAAELALTAAEGHVPPPLAPVAGVANPRGELLARFESLGGTGQGCEFGIVQRLAGIEPLGLLRWTQVTAKSLRQMLDSQFEGIGAPEQTFLETFLHGGDPRNPEYKLIDTRFALEMHTFVRRDEMPEDKMLAQMRRRMVFLRRRLLEDLELAHKIFVFKQYDRNLPDEETAAIAAALRRYGDNTLLYVRYADDDHPSGTVERRAEGLIVGYISGFSMTRSGEPRAPDMPAWISLCQGAVALAGAVSGSGAAPALAAQN